MLETDTAATRRIIALRRFPLFASASVDELATIAENLVERKLPAGTQLTTAGAQARCLHLLVGGCVASPQVARTWSAPHVIGALEVLAGRPLAVTSIATTEVQTLQLSAADVGDLLEDNFSVMLAVVRDLARRLPREAAASRPMPARGISFGLVERLLALRHQLPFANASLQALTMLAKASDELHVPANTLLARPSEQSGLIVLEGILRVQRPGAIDELGPGASLGLLETLANVDHPAHVEAFSDARVLRCSSSAILDVLEDHADVGLAMIARFATALLEPQAAG